MKVTLDERWAERIYTRSRDNCRGTQWGTPVLSVLALVSWINAFYCGGMAFIGFTAAFAQLAVFSAILGVMLTILGLVFWERCGFVRFVSSKDKQLQHLGESNDDLRRQIDALLLDQRRGEPETRIRE